MERPHHNAIMKTIIYDYNDFSFRCNQLWSPFINFHSIVLF
jgi:hypothetical protein